MEVENYGKLLRKEGNIMNSFYTMEELSELGLKSYGINVLISRKASLYGVKEISIGSNVRIDDFCIISGKIDIGDRVHIAAFSALYGGQRGIYLEDFANISSRVSIYAISDDYSGETMTNPMVPEKYKRLYSQPVKIKRHVIIGSGSVVLPGIILEVGSAVGAMSLVTKSTESWSMNAGIPAKKINERSKGLLDLEKQLME